MYKVSKISFIFFELLVRKIKMTDKTKYKSVAIDNNCYKKIEELTTALIPGITISRAQVVRTLVDQKVQVKMQIKQLLVYSQTYTSTKSRNIKGY